MQNNPCQYFKDCGGCKYLDLKEVDYQSLKSKSLIATLSEIFTEEVNFYWIKPPNRRKITLHIDQNNKLGFFKEKSREIITIESCYVAVDEVSNLITKLQNLVKSIPTKTLNKVQVTSFDNVVDVLFFANKELDLKDEQRISDFAKAEKINASLNFKGRVESIYVTSRNFLNLENGVDLTLDSNIFIQASKQGLQTIVGKIREFIARNFSKPISLIDLYSGFGVYSFAVHDLASKISLYEGDQEMIETASKNIKNNFITTPFKAFKQDLFNFPLSSREELKNTDLVIINPPRNGASSQIREIANSNVENLIYVSCNPQTFVRDFLILESKGFNIKEISAIDQFYSTDHFEIVAIIQK